MKKLFIVVLLILGLLIPAVSAETIIDESLYVWEDTSTSTGEHRAGSSSRTFAYDMLYLTNIENRQNLNYVGFVFPGNSIAGTSLVEGQNDLMYTFNGQTNPCRIYITYQKNFLGTITSTQMLIFFDNWDIGALSGTQLVKFSKSVLSAESGRKLDGAVETPNAYWEKPDTSRYYPIHIHSVTIASYVESQNRLVVEEENGVYTIYLTREYPPVSYASRFEAIKSDVVLFYNEDTKNLKTAYLTSEIDTINVILASKTFTYPLKGEGPASPDAIPINIRVQNSQTGALLANAHVKINASVNGTFHEVVNETLPAGTKTYYLQPTGGGLPNPDFYRLVATVEGYNPIMPYIDFDADVATTIYAYLNPIGGAPVNENKTFIDFYVRDLNAKPVAGATVKFGDYTLLTNSAGYTIFEVDKNKNYAWTVSKSGYGSVTGNAIIGSDARYTINAVISPAVTPTLPTPTTTKTPVKPSPTLTSPTGEPVSNMLEWAAAHFGMLLGGGLEIGKIFMWLCFTIPAGVYVGNKAKAGAAGFMAGAGIVTLFFVIIGWVPVWLVVILALIIGLLYARAFSNIGNGGGR